MTKKVSDQHFVRVVLPWAVAGTFFVLYLVTLNRWISIASLPTVAKVAGWDWRPTFFAPLQYLVLFPFQWLPEAIQPIALNLFSAICAALTLAFLTRSVRLLPHDRTRDQRQREADPMGVLSLHHSWLPPLAAALLLGFQSSFWENATAVSGEMLDLLIFAYSIRCLLEFRVSKNETWLSKLAFIYGLGVTNNWALIGYFPVFLIALIWLKGLSFFKVRFILRMLGLGTLGLLLYLLLPAIDSASAEPSGSFWEVLKVNWRFQKNMSWSNAFLRASDLRVDFFRLLLTSVFPLFLICVRWPSFQGDVSPAGDMLGTFFLRLIHVVGIVFTFWVFLDPSFSGKVLGRGHISFLTFYYLSALVAGYLTGYMMLVFGKTPDQTWQRFSKYFAPVAKLISLLVWPVVIAIPVVLVWKNWNSIRATNGPELRRFAHSLALTLPAEKAVILSDDRNLLFLLKALNQQTATRNDLLLETSALPYPAYHRTLRTDFPAFEKDIPVPDSPSDPIHPVTLIQFLDRMPYPLFYLHPSFGYYFERFYPIPCGLISELRRYQTNEIVAPSLTNDEIAQNQKFWNDLQPQIKNSIVPYLKTSRDMQWLGLNYSRAMNTWGVYLQRSKHLEEAKSAFDSALVFNPDNTAAFINEKWNEQLRTNTEEAVNEAAREIDKKISQFRTWDSALTANGLFDGPSVCFQLAQTFKTGGNLRQALALYLRTLDMFPRHLPARLNAITIYLEFGFPDPALEQIGKIQKDLLNEEMDLIVLNLEARAYARKHDLENAEKLLLSMLEKRPTDDRTIRLMVQFYLEINRQEDALKIIEKQLQINPKNSSALLNKGALLIQLKQYDKAIAALDACLIDSPNNMGALMNRALANFLAEKYDAAKKDYEMLVNLKPPRLFAVYYGLAQIALKSGQTDEAIRNFELYLVTAPKETEEYRQVTEQLKELQPPKR